MLFVTSIFKVNGALLAYYCLNGSSNIEESNNSGNMNNMINNSNLSISCTVYDTETGKTETLHRDDIYNEKRLIHGIYEYDKLKHNFHIFCCDKESINLIKYLSLLDKKCVRVKELVESDLAHIYTFGKRCAFVTKFNTKGNFVSFALNAQSMSVWYFLYCSLLEFNNQQDIFIDGDFIYLRIFREYYTKDGRTYYISNTAYRFKCSVNIESLISRVSLGLI